MNNFFLGGDCSKGFCDFVLLDHKKQVVEENFQLDDNYSGHEKMEKILRKIILKYKPEKIYVALESTGGYENNWMSFFHRLRKDLPLDVARVNPAAVTYYGKSKLKRNGSDKISAMSVAGYQVDNYEKILYNGSEDMIPLKRFWKSLMMLKKQKAQTLNHLQSLLYSCNPGVLVYCRNSVPFWVLTLLEKYPTAKKLSTVSASKLTRLPYVTKLKAEHLTEKAKKSVASINDSHTEWLVKQLVRRIIDLTGDIEKQEKYLEKVYSSDPGVELLTSFKGIGSYSAIGLLIRIDGIERFESAKKLCSFFGLHPVNKVSGDGSAKVRMSKQGNSEVRYILYNVARTAIVRNPLLKKYYINLRKTGMKKLAAIGAVMHKILRIVYGMLKNKQNFNPEHIQQKIVVKKQVLKPDFNRRYQKLSCDAPISSRQNKKRKELLISQNE